MLPRLDLCNGNDVDTVYDNEESNLISAKLPYIAQAPCVSRISEEYFEAHDLEGLIRQEIIEDGARSHAEDYLEYIIDCNDIHYGLRLLQHIALRNLKNENTLASVLVFLSHFDYDDVYPEGQVLIMACLSNKSTYVQERALRVYDSWNSKKCLPQLRSITPNNEWLESYINKVINYIEEYGDD